MHDIVVALGLVFVIEGLLWAAAPTFMQRMASKVQAYAPSALRQGGLAAMAIGVFVVWLMRG